MEIIHIVLGKANPNRMNGVNKVVHELATQQSLAGLQASVWGITKDTTHNYPERNFSTRLFKASSSTFSISHDLKQAVVAKKNKAVVFHLHGGFIPAYFSLTQLFIRLGANYVITPHGAYNTIALEKNKLLKKIYLSLFEKKILRHANWVHCLGSSEMEGLQRICSHANAFLCPYGYTPDTSVVSMPNEHQLIIGFCGRIDIYTKGLDLLIQAFKKFQADNPDAALWLIGDGDGRIKLEAMIQAAGLKNVILWGSKYGKEKIDLLKQMHIFMHPSRNEGTPSAVLESAAMGTPVVITSATNLGEAVKKYKAGQVITTPDSNALATALQIQYNLIKENGWMQISQSGKEMVQHAFSWEQIIEQMEDLYNT